jgi:hypothetical protein
VATEQSSLPEPLGALALPGIHDALEMYLQLASETLNAKPSHNFMEYWTNLGPRLESGELSHKIGMNRLNKARVGIKHHGNLPSSDQILEFQSIASSFFEENTPTLFGIAFNEISMVELVQYESARESLRLAQNHMEEGDYSRAMIKVAVSYRQLIDELNEGYRKRYFRSPFYFGRDFKFDTPFHRRTTVLPGDPKQERFEEKLIEAIESIQPLAQALSLGFDYRKYAMFSLLTPVVFKVMNGPYKTQVMTGSRTSIDWPPSREACQFCLDFVIECAVKMRSTDIASMPKSVN